MAMKGSAGATEAIQNTMQALERDISLIEARLKANNGLFADLLTTIANNIQTANQ